MIGLFSIFYGHYRRNIDIEQLSSLGIAPLHHFDIFAILEDFKAIYERVSRCTVLVLVRLHQRRCT